MIAVPARGFGHITLRLKWLGVTGQCQEENETMWDEPSAPYLSPRAPGETDAWTEAATRAGRTGTQLIREVAETVPPPDVANALQLPAGAAAVVRRRTVVLDGKPIEIVDSWYPASIAALLPWPSQRRSKAEP